jgi:hypothetical protein
MGMIPAWNDIMLFYRLFVYLYYEDWGRREEAASVALLCYIFSDNKMMVWKKSENECFSNTADHVTRSGDDVTCLVGHLCLI